MTAKVWLARFGLALAVTGEKMGLVQPCTFSRRCQEQWEVGSKSGVQATEFYWRWRLEVISMCVTYETGVWAGVDRERGQQSTFWVPQDKGTKEMRGASKGGRGGDAGGRGPRPWDPLKAEERVVCVDRPWAVSEVGMESRLTPEGSFVSRCFSVLHIFPISQVGEERRAMAGRPCPRELGAVHPEGRRKSPARFKGH